MISNRRNVSRPSGSRFSRAIVQNSGMSKFVKKNLLVTELPENVVWSGSVGVVVDVADFVGSIEVGSVNSSGDGNGVHYYFTVPDGEFWVLQGFSYTASACTLTGFRVYMRGVSIELKPSISAAAGS